MDTIDFEQVEAMGISRPAYDEVLDILGHQPSIDELSTLLAMWESNGKQQSLYGWLRGQQHAVQRDEYLYTGSSDEHLEIKEPRIKECLDIARKLSSETMLTASAFVHNAASPAPLLYLVGNVSTEFLGSDYARRCLHLVDEPMASAGHAEDCEYIEMILTALAANGLLTELGPVGQGGIFMSLLRQTAPQGFDILAPREVRLDAFLFGEEPGRYLIATGEDHDDAFLLKMDEARLNCCFLGRMTKNRIMVDGYDFGPVNSFLSGK